MNQGTATLLGQDSWDSVLAELLGNQPDVYFRFGYHRLHRAATHVQEQCMLLKEGEAALIVPGMKTKIPGAQAWDLQTCNGYGGPLALGADQKCLDGLWREWQRRAAEEGIIAGFFRLHPLLANETWLPSFATVVADRNTVYVNLADGLEAAWKRASSRHRNMVNRGRRENVHVHWDREDDWREFPDLYSRAMQRLGATDELRYPESYFRSLRTLEFVRLAGIRKDSRLIAGAIFLVGVPWVHYHLAARQDEAPNYVSNCLLQCGIEMAHSLGATGLHLGGGNSNSNDDTLLRFKLSVSAEVRRFKIALVIADQYAYGRASQATGSNPDDQRWLLPYRQRPVA